jgi:hypothetical protein
MTIIIAGAGAALALAAAGVVWRRMRPIKSERFQDRWQEVQKLCSAKESWPKAVVDADRLLDEALKKRHIAGKNMGERLVRAQRLFTDNDSVWFGHKLRSKVEGDPETKLKEDEVKNALIGIRQALKDLGALPK